MGGTGRILRAFTLAYLIAIKLILLVSSFSKQINLCIVSRPWNLLDGYAKTYSDVGIMYFR